MDKNTNKIPDPQIALNTLTLRDWFAGQALIGMVMSNTNRGYSLEMASKDSFAYADAMLRERNKSNTD